jgi:hypothetical protein
MIMQMIDVMKRLQEIAEKTPEAGKAIASLQKMASNQPVAEGVHIDTTGADAVLAQILKLAGMIGADTTINLAAGPNDHVDNTPINNMGAPATIQSAAPAMQSEMPAMASDAMVSGPALAPALPGAQHEVEEADDRPYSNSPHEMTSGIKAAVPSGNDDNKPKLTAPKVAGGDNPTHVAVTFD